MDIKERVEIGRKELKDLFPGSKVTMRKVSFSGFGYGEAYSMKVDGFQLGGVMSAEEYERRRPIIAVIKSVKETRTYNGLPII